MTDLALDPRLAPPHTNAGILQRACLDVLREHEAQGTLPTSARFVWYELVARQVVDKTKARGHDGVRRGVDQDVNDAIMALRSKGIIPWSWIADETRAVYVYAERTESGIDAYASVDPWDGDAPLLIVESRSLAGVLDRIASRYRCSVTATNGQAGGFLRTGIAPSLADDQLVLYCGDHDLAGDQIEENTRRVLTEYKPALRWERLMLTEEQVAEYRLEDLRVVKRDRRYKDGRPHAAVETEALGQRRIVQIVDDRLNVLLPEPLEVVAAREDAELARLRRLIVDAGLAEGGDR